MKIRSGFVSNSSSSSFVLFGFLLDKEDYNEFDLLKKLDKRLTIEIYNEDKYAVREEISDKYDITIEDGDSDNGISEEKIFIGIERFKFDENGYVDSTATDFSEIIKDINDIKTILELTDITPLVITGSRSC
jgi:hypothetical protein